MTTEQFDKLLPGEIVKEIKTGLAYVVMGSTGGGLILVRAIQVFTPKEIDFIDSKGKKKQKPFRRIEVE